MIVGGLALFCVGALFGLIATLPVVRMSIELRLNLCWVFMVIMAVGAGVAGSDRNLNVAGNVLASLIVFAVPTLLFRWGMRRTLRFAKSQYLAAKNNPNSWGYSLAASIARMYIIDRDLETPQG